MSFDPVSAVYQRVYYNEPNSFLTGFPRPKNRAEGSAVGDAERSRKAYLTQPLRWETPSARDGRRDNMPCPPFQTRRQALGIGYLSEFIAEGSRGRVSLSTL